VIIKKFEAQTETFAKKDAVITEEKKLTYEELNRYANHVARAIIEYDRKTTAKENKGIVGLLFEHSAEMIIGVIGALKAGKIYVPLDMTYPGNRLVYMLEDSDARLVLTDNNNLALAERLAGKINGDLKIINVETPGVNGNGCAENIRVNSPGEKLAYILYTSGSTGRPRGVPQTHENVDYYTRNWTRRFSISYRDRMTLFSAFSHDGAVQDMFGALLNGATLYPYNVLSRTDISQLSNWIIREKITIWHSVPTLYRYFINAIRNSEMGKGPFPDLRFILLGGEPIRDHDIKMFRQFFPGSTLANVYGQTESSVNSIWQINAGNPVNKMLIGEPLDKTEIFIINEDGEIVEDLGVGEIIVACKHIAPGYWKGEKPGNGQRRFLHDPDLGPLYRTGDLGRLLADGNIEFMGRKDSQVKIRGFRVEVGEIEGRLLEHPGVKEAGVTLRQDKTGDDYLCAYVVTGHAKGADLQKYLRRFLPDYMVPSYIVVLEQMPRTPSGKIDRNALPAPKIQCTGKDYVPPGNDIEKKLVKIWSDVLGAAEEVIGIDDDFFQLGGHSLKATIMAAKLHQRLGAKVPLAAVFKTPSIRELARYVQVTLETGKSAYESIETVEKKEYYPLSSAQRRLYILQQMEVEHTGYNLPMVTVLEGNLHKECFERTFKQLIARHESLRTSIHLVDEEPVQKIRDQVEFEIEYDDLGKRQEALGNREELRPDGIIKKFLRPFDLSQAPLLRVRLMKVHEAEHILMVDMHHIITDGTSMGIITNEFMTSYAGNELMPLKFRYKDYSQWQTSHKQREAIKEQEDYWLSQFAGEIPRLDLAFDYPRPLLRSFEGNLLTFKLGEDDTKALRALALSRETTLFMTLFSIYNVLLAKLSGQEDIIVGIPIAGRRHNDLQQIIGMFVNTLALRNAPIGEKCFKTFLNEVKQSTIEAYENQEYQFEELVEKLTASIKRDTGWNPLFDVLFVLQNMEPAQGEIRGLKQRPYEYETRRARFDLSLSVYESEQTLTFVMEYSTKLFKKETIWKFFNYFKTIVSLVVKTPGMKIKEIEMISARDRRSLLYDFNDTASGYPQDKTIHELFEEQVARTPDNTAVVGPLQVKNRTYMTYMTYISYRELNRKSDQLASILQTKGVQPGSITGIMLERSLEMIIGILAILKAGAAYMPIDPEYPQERIQYMLKDSHAKTLLTASALTSTIEPSSSTSTSTLTLTSTCQVSPTNLAYIIYTSGSTGQPKGIMIEHENVVGRVINTNFIDAGVDHRLLLTGAIVFDITTFEIWWPLLQAMPLVLAHKNLFADPGQLEEVMAKNKITVLHLIPQLFDQLARQNDKIFAKLNYFLVGGDLVKPRYINIVRNKYPHLKILHMYGPTENTTFSTFLQVNREYTTGIPIGQPVSNCFVYILDKFLQLQPKGVVGELCVSGVGIARGYLNKPEMTAQKFQIPDKSWYNRSYRSYKSYIIYLTGDLGRWLADGNIEFLGRSDHQVKIRGHRIEMGGIESRLVGHPMIKQAAVILHENAGDRYLCAYIVPNTPGQELETNEIKKYLSQTLPAYMIPSFFISIAGIPLTASGKTDRRALPHPGIKIGENYVPPGSEIEKKLVETWSGILGVEKERIGIDDNFFHLGGHSLNAALMTAKIHQVYAITIPLAEVFRASTVRTLADFIAKKAGKERQGYVSVKPIEKKDYYPLSSAQKRLYFIQQMDLNSIAYNTPIVLSFREEMEKNKIETALKKLITRHESLRTSFAAVNEEPVQRIHREQNLDFSMEYYEADETGAKKILKNYIKPFELTEAPLIRSGVVTLPGGNHLWLADMHHIISDGKSQRILEREFLSLFTGEERELPVLKLQYKDYSQWLNRVEHRALIKTQQEYWLNIFAGEVPVLELPYDFPRPQMQSFAGNRVDFLLNEKETAVLKDTARENDVTLYMLLLAIFNILYSKLSGQEDIIIGTPISTRRHVDLQQIVGMMVNTLAMRNYPSAGKTGKQFLQEVKQRTLAAYENQEYPFEELVEKVPVQRDTGRNPIFDVMLNLLNQAEYPVEIGGRGSINRTPPEHINAPALFDMVFSVIELEEHIMFKFEYCTELFTKETEERFIGYLKQLVSGLPGNLLRELREIEIISAEEKKKILQMLQGKQEPLAGKEKQVIHRLFEQKAGEIPGSAALVYEGRHISYGELNRQANRLANLMREKGIGPGKVVGMMTERSPGMIAALLAIIKAGAAILPMDPGYPRERILTMLNDSNTPLLLTRTNLLEQFPITKIQKKENIREVILLDEIAGKLNRYPHENLENRNQPGDLFYVLYTSGSTGKPKGVMLEHRNLVNLLIWGIRKTNLDFSTVLQYSTICFDASFHEIFSTLTAGGKLCLIPERARTELAELCKIIARYEIKTLFLPMAVLKVIFSEEDYIGMFPRCVRHIQTAGEQVVVSRRFRTYIQENSIHLHNHYGPTEAHVVTALTMTPTGEIPTLPSIGRPISNTEIYILDKNENIQPVGVPGELYIGGVQVGRGYMNRPQLTAKKFQSLSARFYRSNRSYPSYIYRSGDLARWQPDGNIEFLGRIDNQVKIRGNRIELGEIENCLQKKTGIKNAVVLAKEDESRDKYLCAYIVTYSKVDHSALRQYLAKHLPDYMLPAYFIPIDKIPMTPSGKVDRKALPKPGARTEGRYVAPRNNVEKKLVEIWAEVFGLKEEALSIDANFFELGGHSLKAITMVFKINKKFNVDISLPDIFKKSTIEALAGIIGKIAPDPRLEIKKTEEREFYKLSYNQQRLWVIQRLNPVSLLYNISGRVLFNRPVDEKAIEKSLASLMTRYESLRTGFKEVNGEPVQFIIKDFELPLRFFDISRGCGSDESEKEKAAHNIIHREFSTPFDLCRPPLIRVILVKLQDLQYELVFNMHHIISDGWSLEILKREFHRLYEGYVSGQAVELPALPLAYKDVAQWQHNYINRGKPRETAHRYWWERIKAGFPALHLPTDAGAGTGGSKEEGAAYRFVIEQQVKNRLNQIAAENHTTLFMVMFAAYNLLLSLLSGQQEIVCGIISAGRDHITVRDIVGFFVNAVVVKHRVDPETGFNDFLDQVKHNVLEAFQYQNYPLELVLEELKVKYPPVSAAINMFNIQQDTQEFRMSDIEAHHIENLRDIKFDMVLFLIEYKDGISVMWNYKKARFKPGTIEYISKGYHKLLRDIASQDTAPQKN
jgi:amino acid adenylation domain-containing protein